MRPSLIFVVLASLGSQVNAQGNAASEVLAVALEALAIPYGSVAKPGTWVTASALGDLDGDGKLDVVVTMLDGHDDIYRGDGTGHLELDRDTALIRDAGPSRDVALADLDNDGLLDVFIVAGDQALNHVYVHRDGGAALVRLADLRPQDPTVTDVESSYGVALADLDDDGQIDAVVANAAGPSVVYANLGLDDAAGFRRLADDLLARPALAERGGAQAVVVDDVDDDGTPDIVLTGRDERDFVYLARGESEFDFIKITTGTQP